MPLAYNKNMHSHDLAKRLQENSNLPVYIEGAGGLERAIRIWYTEDGVIISGDNQNGC